MKALFWNIRGVGNDNSRNLLRSHCADHQPDWLAIIEPEVTSDSINHSFLTSLNLVLFAENQHFDHRLNIWVLCSPDFATRSSIIWGFIDQEHLFEIEAVGYFFTRATRRSSQDVIASKLDRILTHTDFIEHWDNIVASILPRAASDHHPLLLVCTKGSLSGTRPFKILNAWLLDHRFKQIVSQSRQETPDHISAMMGKLKRLKLVLKTWNKEVFGDIDRKITVAKDNLTAIQGGIYEKGDSAHMMDLEFEATVTLQQVLVQQHTIFAQKNRTD
ncbi:hypothetical protein ACS0TY_030593 [Phlomoides rotata]